MINADDDNVRGGTICLSQAGLKIGNSDSAAVDIAAPNGAGVDFAIDGVLYHKADAADISITAGTIATLSTAVALVLLNSSGTLSTVMGTAATIADLAAGDAVLRFPTPTENTCPIGYLHIVNASATTWTAGTDDLDASDVTTTYIDIMAVPVAPLTS